VTVRQLIEFLRSCPDPDALVIGHMPAQGFEDVTTVEYRPAVFNVGRRRSFESIRAIELHNGGNPEFMRQRGMIILGHVPVAEPRIVHGYLPGTSPEEMRNPRDPR
jgi:hypothetical protein